MTEGLKFALAKFDDLARDYRVKDEDDVQLLAAFEASIAAIRTLASDEVVAEAVLAERVISALKQLLAASLLLNVSLTVVALWALT